MRRPAVGKWLRGFYVVVVVVVVVVVGENAKETSLLITIHPSI